MTVRNLLHGLHHKLVVIHRYIGGFINGRQFMLCGSYLIMLGFGRNPQFPEFNIQILHEGPNSLPNGAIIVIFQFLSFRSRCTKQGSSGKNQVISLLLSGMMALLLLAVIWYAPEIILIMAGSQYQEAIWAVAPVSMSLLLLFYAQFFINVEFYYEEKKMLVYGSVGAALLNIALNAWLIPIFGFVAAGYTTLASYIVFALSNCYAMRVVLKKRGVPDKLYNYRGLFWLFAGFTASGFLGMALYSWLAIRIVITLLVLGILICCRKPILDALGSIKKQ